MKRFVKILLGIAVLLLLLAITLRYSLGMSQPTGQEGPRAEALAQRMMDACHIGAWHQTRFAAWTFAERNSYVWDRSESCVAVRLSGQSDWLLLDSRNGALIGSSADKHRLSKNNEIPQAAWSAFCNDSFWLIAPYKVMDPGSRRALVETSQGEALLVSYSSGGVTPGDSYLWYIGESGLPYAYRMWTQIIPIPGIKASWGDWQALSSGALIAGSHKLGPLTIAITDLKSGSSFAELGMDQNIFE